MYGHEGLCAQPDRAYIALGNGGVGRHWYRCYLSYIAYIPCKHTYATRMRLHLSWRDGATLPRLWRARSPPPPLPLCHRTQPHATRRAPEPHNRPRTPRAAIILHRQHPRRARSNAELARPLRHCAYSATTRSHASAHPVAHRRAPSSASHTPSAPSTPTSPRTRAARSLHHFCLRRAFAAAAS